MNDEQHAKRMAAWLRLQTAAEDVRDEVQAVDPVLKEVVDRIMQAADAALSSERKPPPEADTE